MFPWESRGILSFDKFNIYYVGSKYKSSLLRALGFRSKKSSHVKFVFDKNKVKISYLPKNLWRDGGLIWTCIEFDNKCFYFTTGLDHLSIFSAESENETTTELYKRVSEI